MRVSESHCQVTHRERLKSMTDQLGLMQNNRTEIRKTFRTTQQIRIGYFSIN